jgi:hypothetical protein
MKDITETINSLSDFNNIKIHPQLSTPFPLQLNYSIIYNQSDNNLEDSWCQTWSFLFGLFVLCPEYLHRVHKNISSRDYLEGITGSNDTVINQTLYGTKMLVEILESYLYTFKGGKGSVLRNYKWLMSDYFTHLSKITQLVPSFTCCWLHACIRELYPYINQYLITPDIDGEMCSQILYAKQDSILKNVVGYDQEGNLIVPTQNTKIAFGIRGKKINTSDIQLDKYFSRYTVARDILPIM